MQLHMQRVTIIFIAGKAAAPAATMLRLFPQSVNAPVRSAVEPENAHTAEAPESRT